MFWRIQQIVVDSLAGGAVQQRPVFTVNHKSLDQALYQAASLLVKEPNGTERLTRLAQVVETLRQDAARHALKELMK